MSAVPNDIAESQAAALSAEPAAAPANAAGAPATPTKQKKPKAPKVTSAADGQTPAETPVVAAEKPGAQHASEAKKNKTPWYVERTERQLRRREEQSIVFLTKKLVLHSHHAQDVLMRTEKNWSESMITLSETMRNFKPEDQCVEVDAAVDRLLDECVKAIKTTSERLNKTAESHGIDMDDVEVEYTKPAEYKLRVLSPREYRFHTLLLELDALCGLIDKLWLLKLVPDRSRTQIPYDMKRQIMRMVNRVRNLVYRAQASSQRAGAPDAADPRIGTVLDPNAATTTTETSDVPAAGAEVVEAASSEAEDAKSASSEALATA